MKFLPRLAAIGLLSLSFCGAASAADAPSLYQRLCGKDALNAVVNELWAVASNDTRINARFARTNAQVFAGQLVDFLCQASGGPCQYRGQDMRAAHAGMKLSEAEFNALAEDAVKTLDKFQVPAAEKGEVMGLLGSLKEQIVNR